MRTTSFPIGITSAALLFSFFILSCNKQVSNTNGTSATATTPSAYIAVAIDSAGTTDSVYIIQACAPGYLRDSISASGLPSSIMTWVDSAYSGNSFDKAFVIKDRNGNADAYVVVITYNGAPVGLLFNAGGSFVQVLEQREKADLSGPGWHHGGRFGNRDGLHQDTVAISGLPASILAYMSANYGADTLIRAYRDYDSSYLILSRDNGIFVTLFNATGSFVKRVELPSPAPRVNIQSVAQTALPSAVTTYLTNTYPGYVFDEAYSLTVNGVIAGFEIIIDANNTKYAVLFDANGNFLAARVVW